MHRNLVSAYQEWFESYVGGFAISDSQLCTNMELKARHTRRVCDSIIRIAASLGLKDMDYNLAFSAALFHDVGRFEQLKRFDTFSDSLSLDHAALGLQVLSDNRVLEDLDEGDFSALRKAIMFHNKYEVPEDGDWEGALLCRLLRDADKLDILGLITNHFESRTEHPNQALDFGLPDSPGFSAELVDDILDRRMARIGRMGNLNDMKLMYLSWAFDINFPVTLSSIAENRYFERLFLGLPKDDQIARVHLLIDSYIRERRRLWI